MASLPKRPWPFILTAKGTWFFLIIRKIVFSKKPSFLTKVFNQSFWPSRPTAVFLGQGGHGGSLKTAMATAVEATVRQTPGGLVWPGRLKS
jgi:hypothetical protein